MAEVLMEQAPHSALCSTGVVFKLGRPGIGLLSSDTEFGTAFTEGQLDHVLPLALKAVARLHPEILQTSHISRFSWHSFRISLACRLRAIHADDGTIQALCRWRSTESLVKYRRLGRTEYADLLESAAQARIDSIQAATLWRECPPIDDDAKYERLEALAGQIDKAPVAA